MILMMDDVTPNEWGGNPVEKIDEAFVISDDQVDESIDLIKAKSMIRRLEGTLSKALRMRGLLKAINDPIALGDEKRRLREEYRQIEAEIREAWLDSMEFLDKK